jgi:hypothetical protein
MIAGYRVDRIACKVSASTMCSQLASCGCMADPGVPPASSLARYSGGTMARRSGRPGAVGAVDRGAAVHGRQSYVAGDGPAGGITDERLVLPNPVGRDVGLALTGGGSRALG